MSNVDELGPPSFKVATLSFRARSSEITPEPSRDPITRIKLLNDGGCYVLEGAKKQTC